jgi:hypothetical protein
MGFDLLISQKRCWADGYNTLLPTDISEEEAQEVVYGSKKYIIKHSIILLYN